MNNDEYRMSVAIENGEVAQLKQDCRNYLHEVEALKARIVWLECEAKCEAQPAHDVASVPDGFVMVPAEPTDAMKLAGNDALAQHWGAGDAYRAMLAASRLPVQPMQGMGNRSKRLDEIRAEAERFFEWPGDDRSTVTLTSCILFADHIAAPSAPAAPEVKA